MSGVEILNEYAVYATRSWVAVVGTIAFIGGIIFAILAVKSKKTVFNCINFVCFVSCFATVFVLAMIDDNTNNLKDYEYTEYKVTIDDSVSMNEFLDKYEILDQEGKIYTVKERE